MMRTVGMVAALSLLCGTAMAQTASPAACAALRQLQVQGVALTVTKTEWFPAGTTAPAGPGGGASAPKLPAYCRLDGVIDRRTGAAGATYGIGFALALPENWNGMDVDSAVDGAQADPAEGLSTSSRWTNLNTFSGHGGKLVFWHGVSDPWFSALDTIDYYERMTKANGGPEQVRNWSRLFLAPGMGHCGGGPATLDTFDAVTAIVRWVEQGVAPDSLTATGRAFPGRSRPLCAYPLYGQYKGQGNPEDAANFECR
jgi:hypothetical protein